MTPYEMEQHVRGSISVAKSGIQWAGIDERILIPNLVADLRAAFEAGRQAAYEDAVRIAEGVSIEAPTHEQDELLQAVIRAIRARAKEVSHADSE